MEKYDKKTLKLVHEVFSDFYDDELMRNEVNAKRNISRIIRGLKERIEQATGIKAEDLNNE